MYTGKLGIGLIVFNRRAYAAKLFASLAKQTAAGDCDVHLFQDGARNLHSGETHARESALRQVRREFRVAKLPNACEHTQTHNLGIALHQTFAYDYLTGRYDAVLVLEEDIELSPHFVRLARIALDQFSGRPDVFGWSCPARRLYGELSTEQLDELQLRSDVHWYSVAFWAERWRQIRPAYGEYLALLDGRDYRQRPHDQIRAFYRSHGFPREATSQDSGKDCTLHRLGLTRAVPLVNRTFYNGVHGLHSRPEVYAWFGWEHQVPFCFEQDACRTAFTVL